jgi:hypothetical protein
VTRMVGYLRVSTREQATNGGLDAQRAALTAEAEHRGWELLWVEDGGHLGQGCEPARSALRARPRDARRGRRDRGVATTSASASGTSFRRGAGSLTCAKSFAMPFGRSNGTRPESI